MPYEVDIEVAVGNRKWVMKRSSGGNPVRYELDIDQAPKIAFSGDLVAEVASQRDRGRWTELALYRTESGRYVCHAIGRTQRPGEHDRYSGQVCETEADVIAFFGQRWLAKKLYDQAGIANLVEVE